MCSSDLARSNVEGLFQVSLPRMFRARPVNLNVERDGYVPVSLRGVPEDELLILRLASSAPPATPTQAREER